MSELFISAFVTLFVVIDPLTCAPIFASFSHGLNAAQRRVMAVRSVTIAAAILFFFGLLGDALLKVLGISLPAFQIAGGIMLFLIALEMVFERRNPRRASRAQEASDATEPEDFAVFPMALPMIAGPGSIASVLLLVGRSTTRAETIVVFIALGSVLLLTLLSLCAAAPLMRLLGKKVEATLTRLLAVILAALAAQFVIDGINQALRR